MSSWYTKLCAGVLFPLHERLKGHDSVALRRRLEASQWWPAERLADEQLMRLRAFLVEIGQRVPYYSLADLQRLPRLGKPEIRAHVEALKADGHGPLTRYNTGGSSGEPLIFYMGKGRKSHDVAAKWRATRWWGVDIGDPELVVWGSPIELGAQDRVRRLRDGLMRSFLLPAFEMSAENLQPGADRPACPGARRGAQRSGHPGGVRYLGKALRQSAHQHRSGLRLPGGEWLWRARCRLYRSPVPTGQPAYQRRGHHRGDAAARWQPGRRG
jgi:phenylacetate-CoA ligase